MNEIYENARRFIRKNGNDLQKQLFLYLIGETDKKMTVEALKLYQNGDGGWANGLEIEYNGEVSTPMTTAAALGYIYLFDLSDTEIFLKSLDYLQATQKENGSWDDVEDITKFDLPPYMGPGIYVEFKTGMIVKWLNRLNIENPKIKNIDMTKKAIDYLINEFPGVSKGNDVWSAIAYINVFSELPDLNQTPEIMEWAMGIMMPQGLPDADADAEELPWMYAQGMIHDDSPALGARKEKIAYAIRNNQLPSGGWPHQFGTYNAVWAAILIIRFLHINKFIKI